MKKTLLIVLLIFISQTSFCQKDSISETKSNVEIIKDNRIDTLQQIYYESYSLKGYRIQIHSGNKKQPARQVRAKFMQLNIDDNIIAHEIYQQPYYKIRIGDFKTKLEALKFQKEILSEFPNSFIVKDNIVFN